MHSSAHIRATPRAHSISTSGPKGHRLDFAGVGEGGGTGRPISPFQTRAIEPKKPAAQRFPLELESGMVEEHTVEDLRGRRITSITKQNR
jgi:hypothetical protein